MDRPIVCTRADSSNTSEWTSFTELMEVNKKINSREELLASEDGFHDNRRAIALIM